MKNNEARHSSDIDDWRTPPLIIDPARALLEMIDLDPATSHEANRGVGAHAFFDLCDNGYMMQWGGVHNPYRVFLNPPGGRCDDEGIRVVTDPETELLKRIDGAPIVGASRSASKLWWFKLAREWYEGRVLSAVFLGFSVEVLQTTQVDPPLVYVSDDEDAPLERLPVPLDFPCCFPSRRVPFIDGRTGEPVKGNTHASVVIYLPPKKELESGFALSKMQEHFGKVGRCR